MLTAAEKCAQFRFYAELNDFLPPARRFQSFAHRFHLSASVKDVIESMGVPHTEAGLILLNGIAVDFSPVIRDGDRVSVYPEFRRIDISAISQLRPPLKEHRFVLDIHLGRLATYLRMLGFDVLYRNDRVDEELAQISREESRVLLTRDVGLLKRGAVVYGYYVRETEPKRQVAEVLRRYDLFAATSPFNRCLRCNALLKPVAKETVIERLPPKTRLNYDKFRACPVCDRVYWTGSHYDHMQQWIQGMMNRELRRIEK